MMDDNTYNLMMQIVEESQSLYRIKNHYQEDAKGCEDCLEFWKMLEKDKEQHIEDLENLLKEHMCE